MAEIEMANHGLPAALISPGSSPKWMVRAGLAVSALPALALAMSAVMKLSGNPAMVEMLGAKFGYPAALLPAIGLLEAACVLVFLIPRTAVLGAVLVTGYLGGAVATHVRVSDAFVVPLLLGVLVWLGLYLRDPRVRALLPLR
jgi:hypothetical protein